jgi:RimJ/RimL family protein N-acetyltransferase
LNLRRATLDDGPFLLALRNSDDVRSQSQKKDVIAETTHQRWLNASLRSADASIWILECAGERLGYVRASKIVHGEKTGQWLLSVALHYSIRGHGYGSWAIREFCRIMRENIGECHLVAEVFATNETARRLFQKLGFIELIQPDKESGLVRYELRND